MAKVAAKFGGSEKRQSARRPILDTFSVSVVVPKKGDFRLPLHDLSELGLGFDLDMGGESLADYPIREGENLDVQIYLNQSLAIPVVVTVVRLTTAKSDEGEVRRIGAKFHERSKGLPAVQAFVNFLDRVVESGAVKKRTG